MKDAYLKTRATHRLLQLLKGHVTDEDIDEKTIFIKIY
jgi:hypothetical protein